MALLIPGKQTPSPSQSKNDDLGFETTALQTPDSNGVPLATGFWLSEPQAFVFSSFFPPAIVEAGSFLFWLNHSWDCGSIPRLWELRLHEIKGNGEPALSIAEQRESWRGPPRRSRTRTRALSTGDRGGLSL